MSAFIALLARPRARALAGACAVAWLAFGSVGLALVLLVEHATGSFAVAGATAGAFAGCAGALAPVRGRLVDRHGRRALLTCTVVHTIALLCLATGAAAGWPRAASIAAAACAGAAAPPLIATARALWPRVAGPELRRTGHALNALLGDLGTVLGPAAAGGLAAVAGPATVLALVALAPLASACVLGSLMREEEGMSAGTACRTAPAARVLRDNAGMQTVVASGAVLGIVLGAIDVVAPALAQHDGSAGLAALPLAAFAAGSVLSSAWSGQSRRAGGPQRRFVTGFALCALVLPACVVVRSIPALALVLAGAGVGYGLLNVGLLELLDVLVAERHAVEALTWLSSAEGLGLALGAAAAGALAGASPAHALALPAVAAPLGAALAWRRRATLAPRPDPPGPSPPPAFSGRYPT